MCTQKYMDTWVGAFKEKARITHQAEVGYLLERCIYYLLLIRSAMACRTTKLHKHYLKLSKETLSFGLWFQAKRTAI